MDTIKQFRSKTFTPVLKGIDEDRRTIHHLISTGAVDRDGDTVNPLGWDLAEFNENPVVLFGHDHRQPPIGKAIELKVTDEGLEAVTQFPPVGANPMADTVFALNKEGFMKSWSVGFIGTKFSFRSDESGAIDGVDFEEQKLLEYSAVPIPANAEAVNLAVSKGLVTASTLDQLGWQKMDTATDYPEPPTITVAKVDDDSEFVQNVLEVIKQMEEDNELIDTLADDCVELCDQLELLNLKLILDASCQRIQRGS